MIPTYVNYSEKLTCWRNNSIIIIIILGATSSALPVTSGVPQGSILRPLLFLLYQNNFSNSINHSKIATFADDTKTYKVINKEANASVLENDLANFQTSSANANLLIYSLNTDK